MYLLDFSKVLFATFMALFPVVNPIGDAPIFLSMTRSYPQPVQKLLAKKVATYGFMLLAGSLLFGSEILDFFGVSLVVVQIAGGLVVASTGWNLLTQPNDDSSDKGSVPGTLQGAIDHAFFP